MPYVLKSWQQRSSIPFPPASPDFHEYLFAILGHVFNHRAGSPGLLMPCAPNQEFQEDWREINPFSRQTIVQLSSVQIVGLRRDDSRRPEPSQAIRQNVCGYPFARLLELPKSSEPANHQITNNQQRPAVSKDLKGDAHRASRPAF
jgi:hypothetical protein